MRGRGERLAWALLSLTLGEMARQGGAWPLTAVMWAKAAAWYVLAMNAPWASTPRPTQAPVRQVAFAGPCPVCLEVWRRCTCPPDPAVTHHLQAQHSALNAAFAKTGNDAFRRAHLFAQIDPPDPNYRQMRGIADAYRRDRGLLGPVVGGLLP